MSPADWKELGWLLMLMPFGVVLGIGGVFAYCAWRQQQAGPGAGLQAPGERAGSAPMASPTCFFDRPARWLAVKSNNTATVQAALGLRKAAPCSWEEGLAEAGGGRLFVSAPVNGWVMVTGPGLSEPSQDVDVCYRFLKGLSRKLGSVQFFNANSVLHHHAWVLLDGGRVYRAYAWAGETLWNEGLRTAAERELGLLCFDYCAEVNGLDWNETLANNTEKVHQLAARWSLDPRALAQASWRTQGVVGEVPG